MIIFLPKFCTNFYLLLSSAGSISKNLLSSFDSIIDLLLILSATDKSTTLNFFINKLNLLVFFNFLSTALIVSFSVSLAVILTLLVVLILSALIPAKYLSFLSVSKASKPLTFSSNPATFSLYFDKFTVLLLISVLIFNISAFNLSFSKVKSLIIFLSSSFSLVTPIDKLATSFS